MRMILLAEGGVHYELAGPRVGPLVVLLHGGMVPMWVWDAQVAALAAGGLRVLRYDMFGKGLSDCPEGARYDRAFFCRQLGALLDALGQEEPVHLVGFSFGGATAAAFTAAHPQRVAGLALVAPVLDVGSSSRIVQLARLPALGSLVLHLLLPRMAPQRNARLWQASSRAAHYELLFAEQLARPDFLPALATFLRSDALDDYTPEYTALGDTAREGLLVWGSADEDVPAAHTRRIRELVPLLEAHELEGVGHGLPFQRPELLSRLLLDHFRGRSGAAYAATELAGLGGGRG